MEVISLVRGDVKLMFNLYWESDSKRRLYTDPSIGWLTLIKIITENIRINKVVLPCKNMIWRTCLRQLFSRFKKNVHRFWLRIAPFTRFRVTADVTGQQGILTPPKHLIPPVVYPGVRVCHVLILVFFFCFCFGWVGG